MKALSIKQPWVQGILRESKDIENRFWQSKHRGWIGSTTAPSAASAKANCGPPQDREPRVTNKPPGTDTQSDNSESVASLIAYCRDKLRVCPMPQQWTTLYHMLPNRSQVDSAWEPPLPLILGEWHGATGLQKMLRLETHVEWADKWGALESVQRFLHSLQENQCFHLGE